MGPLSICEALQMILRIHWGQGTCLGVQGRGGGPSGLGGPRGSLGRSKESHGTIGYGGY